MMRVSDNGPVTEYFIVDNFCSCLPHVYVWHKLQTPACLSQALRTSCFFHISGRLYLGANLAILQKQEFVRGRSGHKGLGITLCKRIGAYSSLQHLHLKPSFHNKHSLIKYPLCICSFHQPPICLKKNGKLEQLSAIPLFMPCAWLSGIQLPGYSVCKPAL